MRIVFMGTPEFSVPSLEALHAAGYEVVAAVTQPDRPVGRKAVFTPPPVKIRALELDIPVFQHERIRRREPRQALEEMRPDLFVTAAFGQILSQRVLDIPALGTINVHASLLPKYRGSSPINWALINGEEKTGITTMFTDAGIDTGDMLLQEEIQIGADENAEELSQRLSALGAKVLIDTLKKLEEGSLQRTPQIEEEASYYPMLTRDMGQMDFKMDCMNVYNRFRGLKPWPGSYFLYKGQSIKVFEARPEKAMNGRPGELLVSSARDGLVIACGKGAMEIEVLQAPGGKQMKAQDYLRGKPMGLGEVLGID